MEVLLGVHPTLLQKLTLGVHWGMAGFDPWPMWKTAQNLRLSLEDIVGQRIVTHGLGHLWQFNSRLRKAGRHQKNIHVAFARVCLGIAVINKIWIYGFKDITYLHAKTSLGLVLAGNDMYPLLLKSHLHLPACTFWANCFVSDSDWNKHRHSTFQHRLSFVWKSATALAALHSFENESNKIQASKLRRTKSLQWFLQCFESMFFCSHAAYKLTFGNI